MKRFLFSVLLVLASFPALAAPDPSPWKQPNAIIIPDPYSANAFDFERAFADPKIKGVILKGASGLKIDPAVYDRAREAKRLGIPFGVYLLGLSPSPQRPSLDANAQADFLVKIGHDTGASLLALDIEGLRPNDISIPDVARVVERVYQLTGRYPVLYMNGAVAKAIAQANDGASIFARTPLWIAGTRRFVGNRVWPTFALWQFGAEWDCPDAIIKDAKRRKISRYTACLPYRQYPVAGSQFDLDINVLNGGNAEFEALFGLHSSSVPVAGSPQ